MSTRRTIRSAVDVRRRQRALAESLSAWRQDRIAAAEKRRAEKAKANLEARSKRSHGTDRVPAHLQGLHLTVEPHTASAPRYDVDGNLRRGGRPITTEDRPAGNHETRRLRGQRGKQRRPRVRELRRAGAANRLPDSPMALERAATRQRRDRARGRA